jgi:hypothetical protein
MKKCKKQKLPGKVFLHDWSYADDFYLPQKFKKVLAEMSNEYVEFEKRLYYPYKLTMKIPKNLKKK